MVVGIIFEIVMTWIVPKKDGMVVSIAEYRQLLGDDKSSDERIVERLQYLEAFFRNIIKLEIKKYENTKHGTS